MHDHRRLTKLGEKIADIFEAHDLCPCAESEIVEALDETNLFSTPIPLDDLSPKERP